MDISDLKEFLALAKYQSFMEAAENCFITQSTLSKHIKRLEKEVGCTLFLRNPTGVSLSSYGKLMVPYAQKIVDAESQCLKALKDYEKKMHETLSIGSTPLMVPYDVTNAISGFRKAHPSSSINIVEGETAELIAQIQQKKLKLAFILVSQAEDAALDEKIPNLVRILYRKDVLSAVLPVDHPAASKECIPLEDLSDETFIFWSDHTAMYDLCYNFCMENQFEPDISLTSPRGQSIVEMVGENMGVSIMPREQALHVNNPSIAAIPIIPEEQLYIYLIYQQNSPFSEIEQLFISYIQSIIPSSL